MSVSVTIGPVSESDCDARRAALTRRRDLAARSSRDPGSGCRPGPYVMQSGQIPRRTPSTRRRSPGRDAGSSEAARPPRLAYPRARRRRRSRRTRPERPRPGSSIDVIRATSTICQALASGYRRVLCAAEVEEARALREALGEGILGGERQAVRIPGFDLGNSPREYLEPAGETLILSTTNGTRAVVAAAAALRARAHRVAPQPRGCRGGRARARARTSSSSAPACRGRSRSTTRTSRAASSSCSTGSAPTPP